MGTWIATWKLTDYEVFVRFKMHVVLTVASILAT